MASGKRKARAGRDTAERREDAAAAALALRGGSPYEADGGDDRPAGVAVRHDLAALAAALALLAAGAALHRALAAPEYVASDHVGLRLERPAGWPSRTAPARPPQLARAVRAASASVDRPGGGDSRQRARTVYTSPADAMVRVEVQIRPRPRYSNLPAALELARAARRGESYWTRGTTERVIAGRDWFRTRFRYAYTGSGSPRVAEAVEYAAASGDRLYVVTLHGDAGASRELERAVAPTLSLSAERARSGGTP